MYNHYRWTPLRKPLYIQASRHTSPIVAMFLDSLTRHMHGLVGQRIGSTSALKLNQAVGAFLCPSTLKSPALLETDTPLGPSSLTGDQSFRPVSTVPNAANSPNLICRILPASPRLAVRYCWSATGFATARETLYSNLT